MDDLPPFEEAQPEEPQGLPHSRQAEEAVIGSVLINPESYYDVAQFLRAEDFYIIRNRWIWEVFSELHERHMKVDYVTVCEFLENRGQLSEIGGAAYITAMINHNPSKQFSSTTGHVKPCGNPGGPSPNEATQYIPIGINKNREVNQGN